MNMTQTERDAQLLRGDDARAHDRELLARVGRQPLDPAMSKGARFPRRDDLATEQGRKAAEVIRDAITEYMSRHRATV